MVFPSIIIITLIAKFISNFSEIAWVKKALTGINVAVAAILTNAVYTFSKKSVKNLFGFILLVISFVLIFILKVGTVYVIFGSAILGVILAALRGEFKKEAEND
jgi:chromate transporter